MRKTIKFIKAIFLSLAVLLMLIPSHIVFSEEIINIEECSCKDQQIYFWGSLESATDETILVIAYDSANGMGDDAIKAFEIAMPDEEGNFSGNISIYDDEKTAKSYNLRVEFRTENVSTYKDLLYYNNKLKTDIVGMMNDKADGMFEFMTNDVSFGENVIESLYVRDIFDAMGVWIDEYDQLEDGTKENINNSTKGFQSIVTNDILLEICNASIITAVANEKDETKTIILLEKLDKDILGVKIEGVDESFFDIDSKRKKSVVENLINNIDEDGLCDYKQFLDAVLKSMVFEKISVAPYSNVDEIILNNKEILLGEDEDDKIINKLEGLSSKKADSAMRILVNNAKGEMFNSTKELLSAVDEAMDEADKNGGSTSGGGNSGSISKGSTHISVETVTQVQEPEADKKVFSDLAGYEWASNAIYKLSEKGVVDGVENNMYEPSRNVNREEFVKLICEAFGFKVGGASSSFVDVKKSDWFYDYVSKAVGLNIVNGVSENTFGSKTQITREDMAVMVYRAMKAANVLMPEQILEFTDNSDISDYAKEAVGVLGKMGVINGVGNGKFAPKDQATRAESAVIIYRCMEGMS